MDGKAGDQQAQSLRLAVEPGSNCQNTNTNVASLEDIDIAKLNTGVTAGGGTSSPPVLSLCDESPNVDLSSLEGIPLGLHMSCGTTGESVKSPVGTEVGSKGAGVGSKEDIAAQCEKSAEELGEAGKESARGVTGTMGGVQDSVAPTTALTTTSLLATSPQTMGQHTSTFVPSSSPSAAHARSSSQNTMTPTSPVARAAHLFGLHHLHLSSDSSGHKPKDEKDTHTNGEEEKHHGKLVKEDKTEILRRRNMANGGALTDYEADLTSRDRMKQKEAIRRVLASKVRTDWEWDWPPKTEGQDQKPTNGNTNGSSEAQFQQINKDDLDSPIIENFSDKPSDSKAWKERDDWTSEIEDDSDSETETANPIANSFGFDCPDSVGQNLMEDTNRTAERRKLKCQRKLNAELKYNAGARCFLARRDAWTRARYVRRPVLAKSPTATATTTIATNTSIQSSTPNEKEDESLVTTLIPFVPPILPPNTPMRANIHPRHYTTIYDKVIVQAQTPMCPINLSVITKCCVEGWKRDGEWPPKGTEPEGSLRKGTRLSAGFGGDGSNGGGGLGLGKNGAAGQANKGGTGGFKRGLQRVFGAVGAGRGEEGLGS